MSELRQRLQSTLGHAYTIERELDGGGMSRVFVAIDQTLGRNVVVKVLAPELEGQVSLDRFRREIAIAASLQHPHIVPLLDAGTVDGLPWFTMPLVEGESLRRRLADSGELPLGDAIRILREVASALGYAHSRGVVHRDIKPGNVLLVGGVGMVTDFGVAKALTAATKGGEPGLTPFGVALGTPAYMSPEQASGDPAVDHRADIYSWGVLAYELLAGHPPFEGRDSQAMLAAHVAATPEDIGERRRGVPPSLARLVMRCLEKRPADRPQSADELMHALDELTTPTSGMGAARPRGVRRSGVMLAAAGALVLATLLGIAVLRPERQTTVVADQPVADSPALELDAAISPDGAKVAYATASDGLEHRIVVRQIGTSRTLAVSDAETGDHRWPRWSPDGTRIAFMAHGGIYEVAALGGPVQRLTQSGAFPAWSPDGQHIAFADSVRIRVVDVGDGATRDMASVGIPSALAWSPDGRFIAYARGSSTFLDLFNFSPSSIWLLPVSGGQPHALTDSVYLSTSPVWTPDGRSILFVSNASGTRDVYQQRLGRDARPSGAPIRLTTGLNAHSITISHDGTRVACSTLVLRNNIWSAPIRADGATRPSDARPVTTGNESIESMAISPDGKWLVYDSNRNSNSDIYKLALESGAPRGEPIQLTADPADDFAPRVSPDGHEIAFYSTRLGTRDVFVMQADGRGVERISALPGDEVHPRWSADGTQLFFTYWAPDGQFYPYQASRGVDRRWRDPRPLDTSGYRGQPSPAPSPDGRFLAVTMGDSLVLRSTQPALERTVFRLPAGHDKLVAQTEWSPDASTLFVQTVSHGVRTYWSVSVGGGTPRVVMRAEDPQRKIRRDEFATDGKRLFFTIAFDDADVRVLTLRP